MAQRSSLADQLSAEGTPEPADPTLAGRAREARAPFELREGGDAVGVVVPMEAYRRLTHDLEELEFQMAVLQGYREAVDDGTVSHDQVMAHFKERRGEEARLAWSPAAERDVVQAIDYLWLFSRAAVERLGERIGEATARLLELPSLGMPVEIEGLPAGARNLLVDAYSLVYLPSDEEILVLRVWPPRRERA